MNALAMPRSMEQEFITVELPDEIREILQRPLPPEAIKPHPTKSHLSTIKPAFVIERMLEAFGPGGWQEFNREIGHSEKEIKYKKGTPQEYTATVYVGTVHGTLVIQKYGIHLENYGGSDNDDLGDALKGAATDAFTKNCSHLGIGLDVYKGKGDRGAQSPDESSAAKTPALRVCPKCGEVAVIKGKAEFGGGYVCWKNKGGCNEKFPDSEFESKPGQPPKKEPASTTGMTPVDKITISGTVTDWSRKEDIVFVRIGQRTCASFQPDIKKQLAGTQGRQIELLVSPVHSDKYGDIFQIHKVINTKGVQP